MADVYHIPAITASEEFQSLIETAVHSLLSGCIIAMPSDTLYGLFAGYGAEQIERLHRIKNRPVEKPFLLVFPELYPLDEFVDIVALDNDMRSKIQELWPGRNTLILPKKSAVSYPPGNTIAIRKPSIHDNLFFYETLNKYNHPLLAPSLNIHGDAPLNRLDDIELVFGNKADAVFFDVSFIPGSPSQIWDLTKKPYIRLR